jgi:hypothetical protein
MPIVVTCSGCGTRLNAPDDASGKSLKCPKCGTVATAPAAEEIVPVPRAKDLAEERNARAARRKRRDEKADEERRYQRREVIRVIRRVMIAVLICITLVVLCCVGGSLLLGELWKRVFPQGFKMS